MHFVGLLCMGVAQALSGTEDFEVCETTDDAPTARRLFEQHRPGVVIIGPSLRGGDGIQLIKDIHKMDRNAAILMLSAVEDPTFIQRVWRAGARGYLRVFDGHLELVEALRKICDGHRYVSKALNQLVYEGYATRKTSASRLDSLSDREREVFLLIGRGSTVSEIASEMGVSGKSVETYLKRIKDKLGLKSTPELRERAMRSITKSAWKQMEQLHPLVVRKLA